MLTDMLDVVFQRNPFEMFTTVEGTVNDDRTLYVAGEVATFAPRGDHQLVVEHAKKSADHGLNLQWIETCLGQQDAARLHAEVLAEKPVLCSGTTLGRRSVMERYLQRMDVLTRSAGHRRGGRFAAAVSTSDHSREVPWSCSQLGFDQGLHNYLVYGEFEPTGVKVRIARAILTMNGVREVSVGLNRTISDDNHANVVQDTEGGVFSVIHQVNRCKRSVRKFVVFPPSNGIERMKENITDCVVSSSLCSELCRKLVEWPT